MEYISKKIFSNQTTIHDNLDKVVQRNKSNIYQKPISDFSISAFKEILEFIRADAKKEIIFDMGCGVGESSYNLAIENPDNIIIGIDKSISRIERNNFFKKSPPDNLLLVRGELVDLWRLIEKHKSELRIKKQYILYPNPWPKKKLLKQRFHAHPIFQSILALPGEIELRTNWEIYIQEFCRAIYICTGKSMIYESFTPEKMISPFEKKYYHSGHVLYRMRGNINQEAESK